MVTFLHLKAKSAKREIIILDSNIQGWHQLNRLGNSTRHQKVSNIYLKIISIRLKENTLMIQVMNFMNQQK